MQETYNALIKLPIGKKRCTLVIERHEGGTFDGTFSVLGSTAPVVDGKIDEEGSYTGACTITTPLGTLSAVTEGHITPEGFIEGVAKSRMGVMQIKSEELW